MGGETEGSGTLQKVKVHIPCPLFTENELIRRALRTIGDLEEIPLTAVKRMKGWRRIKMKEEELRETPCVSDKNPSP
jgi:hypothetical protein